MQRRVRELSDLAAANGSPDRLGVFITDARDKGSILKFNIGRELKCLIGEPCRNDHRGGPIGVHDVPGQNGGPADNDGPVRSDGHDIRCACLDGFSATVEDRVVVFELAEVTEPAIGDQTGQLVVLQPRQLRSAPRETFAGPLLPNTSTLCLAPAAIAL